ncbi:cupin [Microbacteriaceae bacterium 4G12]
MNKQAEINYGGMFDPMKIFNFDEQAGKHLTVFESNFIMSKILNHSGNVHMGCLHLPENGVVGYHKAVISQLLLIVQGEGWVCGVDKNKVRVRAGQAVFWDKDEYHETSTETGLMAIVIESENLEQSLTMPSVELA